MLPFRNEDEMARPAGLEPTTTSLEGRCSIQLSYGRSCRPTDRRVGRAPQGQSCSNGKGRPVSPPP